MKLYYSHNLNPRVAVAVARHLGSPVEFVRARPFHPAQREDFRKLNPNTRVPVLEEEGGKTLWETDAIACRLSELADSDFWRRDANQAQMIQWVSWATHHLNHAAAVLYFDRVVIPQLPPGAVPPAEPAKLEEALADFRQFAAILDAHLKGRRWVLDDGRLSYADFRVASALPFAGKADLPVEAFPEMARWHRQLMELKAWREPFAEMP